jgi:pimeloyl-ACP methyl ester carboxylesterase
MPKVKVNDIQMYYEVKGEGFPLMMINGLGGNLAGWDPRSIEAFSKKFKLILFDNRDAGRTDTSEREYTMETFADDTAGLMNALGISKAHIFGQSMGGMIAQEFAINYPEKTAKLVLCSTHCGGSKVVQPSQKVSRMLTIDTSGMSQEEYIRMFATIGFTDDYIKNSFDSLKLRIQKSLRYPISAAGYKRQLNAIGKFNAYERLQQIKAPTLVLHGRKDVLIPPENGSILAEAIPNAKLVFFEKSAHILAEEIEEVIDVIKEFLL